LDLVHREWQRMSMIRRTSFAKIPSRPGHSVEEHDGLLALMTDGGTLDEIERAARAPKPRTMNEFLTNEAAVAGPGRASQRTRRPAADVARTDVRRRHPRRAAETTSAAGRPSPNTAE